MNILSTGTVLENRYRITRLLGEGGMSRVYMAEDTRLGVRVAIKENLQTSREAQTQFEREAQILARLSHANLPRVTDHFVDAQTGRQYLVMDYVEGEDLEAMLKRTGPLPEATALAWMRQILDALEYLHRQQPPIIHRDVKPGNIKITPEGKAVLVDFGIAKVYDPRQATLTGARAVTPGYAPPEQYGLRTTERSDIYALGATLYTMLTGQVPPEAPLRMSGEATLVPPSRIVAGKASPPVERAILQALEVETSKRWASVAQLRAALEGRGVVLPAPRVQPPTPPTTRVPPHPPVPWLWPALALVLLLVCSLAILPRLVPIRFSTPTPAPTVTQMPTSTPVPPIATLVLPTATLAPTRTPVPPTATLVPPTATPTSTPVPPTATLVPPTPLPTRASYRCFEARRRHWERGGGEIGGIVYDLNGQPFSKATVHLYIDSSNWKVDLPIAANGMYNFCCLTIDPNNLQVVELVGSGIKTVEKYSFRLWNIEVSRVLVDFYEVPCP